MPSLKILSLGGETVTMEIVARWVNKVQLTNIHGPGECAVWCTYNTFSHTGSDPANIGHPVCGHGWITDPDDYNKLAPVGAVGELLMEGPHLARGYLNDRGRTEAAFVDNLAWVVKGEMEQGQRRRYRTGDLVRLIVRTGR